MMAKDASDVVDEAVDYRSGTPWDFGLLPEKLRRVAACMKARVKAAEVPFGGEGRLSY